MLSKSARTKVRFQTSPERHFRPNERFVAVPFRGEKIRYIQFHDEIINNCHSHKDIGEQKTEYLKPPQPWPLDGHGWPIPREKYHIKIMPNNLELPDAIVHVPARGNLPAEDHLPTLVEMKKNRRQRQSVKIRNDEVELLKSAVTGILIERVADFLAKTCMDLGNPLKFWIFLRRFADGHASQRKPLYRCVM